MLRMVLVGVVLAAAGVAAPACSRSDAPASGPRDAAAGKVIAVTGTVTATPAGGTPRPLAVGDAVASDDVIGTGADGRVDVRLARNQALLHLDGGQTVRLEASIAWSLPAQSGSAEPASVPPSELASAGRPAENEAAHTMGPPPTTPPTLKDEAPPASTPRPLRSATAPARADAPVPRAQPTAPAATKRKQDVGDGAIGADEEREVARGPQPLAPSAAQLTVIRACLAHATPGERLVLVVDGLHAVRSGTRGGATVDAGAIPCLTSAVADLALAPGAYAITL